MATIKSMLTINRINELLESGITNDVSLINCNINHNEDLEQSAVKVVFTRDCIKKIIKQYREVNKVRTQERGTFFYGRIVGNMVVFDCYKSDFKVVDGIFKDAAVTMEDCLPELEEMTTPTENNPIPYDVVMHFHVHPSYVLYENEVGSYVEKDNNGRSLLISDNDYLTYAWLDQTQQYNPNQHISYLGGLISVNYGNPRFACVMYDDKKKTFINFTNIYYLSGENVYRLNRPCILNSKLLNEEHCHKIIDSIKVFNEKSNVKVTI